MQALWIREITDILRSFNNNYHGMDLPAHKFLYFWHMIIQFCMTGYVSCLRKPFIRSFLTLILLLVMSGCFVFNRNCNCPSWSDNGQSQTDKLVSIESEKDHWNTFPVLSRWIGWLHNGFVRTRTFSIENNPGSYNQAWWFQTVN